MEVDKEIVFNLILDMRKNKIDKFDRAKIIREYINETKNTVSSLARELGISKTTISDWLAYERISREQMDKLVKEEKIRETDIFKQIRVNKDKDIKEINFGSCMDTDVKESITILKKYIDSGVETPNSMKLLLELKKVIDDIIKHLEDDIN